MRSFWFRYLLVAVAGTAAVYVAAPLARPYVRHLFPPPAPDNGAADDRDASPRRPRTAASAGSFTPDEPGQGQAVPARPDADGRDASPRGPRTVRGTVPTPSDVFDPSDDSVPALLGIYLAGRGEQPGWGITHEQAAVFTLDGTRLKPVPGGTLLEYRGTRESSKGSVVEGVLLLGDAISPPRLVSKKDVYLFTGSYKQLSPRQRQDLVAYYTLRGKIGLRKNELLQVSAAKNPFFAAYQDAHQRLMKHIEDARALTARRDEATGLKKTQLEDQLRELKMLETRLRADYNAQHQKFRAWKDQHAGELPVLDNDPAVRQWRQEMESRRSSIPGLTY